MRLLALAGITGLLSMTLTAPAQASGVPEQWFSGSFVAQVDVRAVDVNGDGFDDLVSFNTFSLGCRVLLSTGSGFQPQQNWGMGTFNGSGFRGRVNLAGDVTGDGRADVIAVNPQSANGIWIGRSSVNSVGRGYFELQHWLNSTIGGEFGNLAADVDADGDTDVLGLFADPVPVLLARSNGTAAEVPLVTWGEPVYGERTTLAADVTGDNRADAILLDNTGIRVVRANPNWYNTREQWSTVPFHGTKKTLTTDIDVDGDADLIAINDTDVQVMRSTGTGFDAPEIWHPTPFFGTLDTLAADVDGDNDPDLVAVNVVAANVHEVQVLRTQ